MSVNWNLYTTIATYYSKSYKYLISRKVSIKVGTRMRVIFNNGPMQEIMELTLIIVGNVHALPSCTQ